MQRISNNADFLFKLNVCDACNNNMKLTSEDINDLVVTVYTQATPTDKYIKLVRSTDTDHFYDNGISLQDTQLKQLQEGVIFIRLHFYIDVNGQEVDFEQEIQTDYYLYSNTTVTGGSHPVRPNYPTVNLDNYYTKEEVDEKIDNIVIDCGTVQVGEVTGITNNTVSTVSPYTRSEVSGNDVTDKIVYNGKGYLDPKNDTFESKQQVLNDISRTNRIQGMSFNVVGDEVTEYWFLGGTTDTALVKKRPDLTEERYTDLANLRSAEVYEGMEITVKVDDYGTAESNSNYGNKAKYMIDTIAENGNITWKRTYPSVITGNKEPQVTAETNATGKEIDFTLPQRYNAESGIVTGIDNTLRNSKGKPVDENARPAFNYEDLDAYRRGHYSYEGQTLTSFNYELGIDKVWNEDEEDYQYPILNKENKMCDYWRIRGKWYKKRQNLVEDKYSDLANIQLQEAFCGMEVTVLHDDNGTVEDNHNYNNLAKYMIKSIDFDTKIIRWVRTWAEQ